MNISRHFAYHNRARESLQKWRLHLAKNAKSSNAKSGSSSTRSSKGSSGCSSRGCSR